MDEDCEALAAWVRRVVLASKLVTPFDDWPPRYVHSRPHLDLGEFHRI